MMRARWNNCAGITLIEILVLLLILVGIIVGACLGLAYGNRHGAAWALLGLVGGAIVGGCAIFAAGFLIWLPSAAISMLRRLREPADSACRCDRRFHPDRGRPTPRTLVQEKAAGAARLLSAWPQYAALPKDADITAEELATLMNRGELSAQRVGIAAGLGHLSAVKLGAQRPSPVIGYKHWAKLPRDLQVGLRSGLPPRLCLVWAVACVERVVPAFLQEFHEDIRPVQAYFVAIKVLNEGAPEALAEGRSIGRRFWDKQRAGCRIVHRGVVDRILDRPTRGEQAAAAIFRLLAGSVDFVEPASLWTQYAEGDIGNGYYCERNRCNWSQPSWAAEEIASEAAKAATSPDEEVEWQRALLARMILTWKSWDEDQQAWQENVDTVWIPRIQAELKLAPFHIPAFLKRVRRELVPWRN